MNILKWILHKREIEYEISTLKRNNEKREEKLKEHERWQRGYLDHISYLEEENKKLKEEKENIVYKKLLTDTYIGRINLEFISKEPREFMRNLVSDIIKKFEKTNMAVTDYSLSPKELSHTVYFGRGVMNESTKFHDDYLRMQYALNDLDYELETICMYGNEEDFEKYLKQITELVDETSKLRKLITEEDVVHEMQ